MIGFLRTRVRKQPIIALYFESETVLQFYNLDAWYWLSSPCTSCGMSEMEPLFQGVACFI